MPACRALPAALLVVALGPSVLGVAACGDDDSGDEEGSPALSTVEDTTPRPRPVSGGEPLGPADEGIDGVEAFEVAPPDHSQDDLEYDHSPPVGGEHYPAPATCGFYEDGAPPDETLVHSLEHGAVWVAYGRDLPAEQIATLERLADEEAKFVATPADGLDSPLVVTSWGRQLALDSADDPRLVAFVEQYREGELTPEPGAVCRGIGEPAVVAPAA